ncbi:MAG: 4a-hydroxytetrahydrobiopterin dehydratase [Chloroflexota bacterium]|jgi:4a-hydroxytetrahydrobiopterin dehydratase|nr:4a-hydroxytetrahydrobiopterin dehydratase [Chloroflexota bacterium]
MPYATPLTDAELAEALVSLPAWTREGEVIRLTVELRDFREAVALVNAVADAAEAADHHPDIHITGYRRVSFELTTHAAKALTVRDVELAQSIEGILVRFAPDANQGAGTGGVGG